MNIPYWNGSSSFSPGETSFGFYDNDVAFQIDADKVTLFCARRLGYPMVDIELQDVNFYTAFEEAITTYGNELYAYKVRDNQLSLEGSPINDNLNESYISSNMGGVIKLAKQYGAEAGSGGNVEYHKGSIPLTASIQDYDLNKFVDTGSLGIEIKKVFYESSPAIVRYYDPYSGTGFGYQALFDSFGFGGFSPAINFLMMPLNYDLQTLQAIELNDQVRKSNFSFEIKNNKIRLFPIPSRSVGSVYFEYIKLDERNLSSVNYNPSVPVITDVSNIPYTNPVYSQINSIGRQWIFEYTLAVCKEMLGYIRGKYDTIPIPNSTTVLNHSSLLSAAANEKTTLIERLRAYFDETSRKSLLARRSQEAEHAKNEINQVPLPIYIG